MGGGLMAINTEHTHNCTGPDLRCKCGFVLRVQPVWVSIEIGERKQTLVNEGFNCETIGGAIAGLEEAIDKLRKIRGY
jgi:hypothetical protein